MIARPAGSMSSHVLLDPRLFCDHQLKQNNVAFTLEEITHHGFTSRFCSYLKHHKSVFDNSTNEHHINFMEKNVRIPSEPHNTRATAVFRLVGRSFFEASHLQRRNLRSLTMASLHVSDHISRPLSRFSIIQQMKIILTSWRRTCAYLPNPIIRERLPYLDL
jgi:thermostable 8-oxoguanine DNA glycosylase